MTLMNFDGLRAAESGAGRKAGLPEMRARFAETASDPGMFGEVPNADRAAAALETAALTMLAELERAGISVDDISRSAAAAADTGESHEATARRTLTNAHDAAYSTFVDRMATEGR
jgi:hypothetical protein